MSEATDPRIPTATNWHKLAEDDTPKALPQGPETRQIRQKISCELAFERVVLERLTNTVLDWCKRHTDLEKQALVILEKTTPLGLFRGKNVPWKNLQCHIVDDQLWELIERSKQPLHNSVMIKVDMIYLISRGKPQAPKDVMVIGVNIESGFYPVWPY